MYMGFTDRGQEPRVPIVGPDMVVVVWRCAHSSNVTCSSVLPLMTSHHRYGPLKQPWRCQPYCTLLISMQVCKKKTKITDSRASSRRHVSQCQIFSYDLHRLNKP